VKEKKMNKDGVYEKRILTELLLLKTLGKRDIITITENKEYVIVLKEQVIKLTFPPKYPFDAFIIEGIEGGLKVNGEEYSFNYCPDLHVEFLLQSYERGEEPYTTNEEIKLREQKMCNRLIAKRSNWEFQ
jgi:hypothetical protein